MSPESVLDGVCAIKADVSANVGAHAVDAARMASGVAPFGVAYGASSSLIGSIGRTGEADDGRATAANLDGAFFRLMHTPKTTRMLANERSVHQVAAQYLFHRHGETKDAAALAAFLLPDQSSLITGQVIGRDGFNDVRPLLRAGSVPTVRTSASADGNPKR